MENNRNSPATRESQTPTFPAGGEGNSSEMAGMMFPYYTMYHWMGGMVPQMPGVSGGMTGMTPGMMPGMMPGAAGMGCPGWNDVRYYAGHVYRCLGGGRSSRAPQSPGDNVYRPYMDLLSSDSPQNTLLETQFTGIETFSFE